MSVDRTTYLLYGFKFTKKEELAIIDDNWEDLMWGDETREIFNSPGSKETLVYDGMCGNYAYIGLKLAKIDDYWVESESCVEIPQDQGTSLDDFARTALEEGEDFNTYTASADLQVAFKMYDIDVANCDYVVVKFAEPVPAGWCIAFWAQGGTDNVEIPAGSTEYKYVFADDPKCAIENDILPQICVLTLWGAEKPLVMKVTGVYKHQVEVPVSINGIAGGLNDGKVHKVLRDGKIVIIKGDKEYNVTGAAIK